MRGLKLAIKAPAAIAVDFETLPIRPAPHNPPEPVGVSIRWPGDQRSVYHSWGHANGYNNCDKADGVQQLKWVWESGLPLLFHGSKFDIGVACVRLGFPMPPWDRIHDTMFLAYLNDPHSRSVGLKETAQELLNWPPDERDAVAEWVLANKRMLLARYPHLRKISKKTGLPVDNIAPSDVGAWIFAAPGSLVAPYAEGDTDRALALFNELWPVIQDAGMGYAYDTERELMPILLENELTGMRVDLPRLEQDLDAYGACFNFAEDWLRRELHAGGLNFDADQDVASVLSQRGIVAPEAWVMTEATKAHPEGQLSMSKDNLLPEHFTGPNGAKIASALGYRNRLKTCLSMFMQPWYNQASINGGYITTNWNQTRGTDSGGGTRCMPAGELVQTSRGYLPIERVRVGDAVLSHLGEPRRVLATINNGTKPIVEVILSNGLSLRTTLNHQYFSQGAWVRADELTPGTEVSVFSDPEEWRVIPSWEEWSISSWGRVKFNATSTVRALTIKNVWGHLKTGLRRNGCRKRGKDYRDFSVHRLVASVFGVAGAGPEVRHLNGVGWDNTLDNLRYGSALENRQDSLDHGTLWARRYGSTKLSEESVRRIRELPVAQAAGDLHTNADLADEYGVCERLIRAVRNGDRWPEIINMPRPCHSRAATVISVSSVGEAMTYGLEVEIDHSHVTGGIATHNTGRPSTNKHNFLNVSKSWDGRDDQYEHPRFLISDDGIGILPLPLCRQYVLPDLGEWWIHRDFAGQELRIFAEFEQGRLFEQYQSNPAVDPHKYVGDELEAITGRPFSSREMRTKVKVLNFTGLYGGGVPAVQKKLRCSYDEAKGLKDFHAKALPGRVILNDEIKKVTNLGLPIRTLGGRLYFPEQPGPDGRSKVYKLINYAIQGSAADYTKRKLIMWHKHPLRQARFLVTVYDEINGSAGDLVKEMKVLKEVMEAPIFDMTVAMLSDAKYGRNWGELTKGEPV